MFKMRTQQLLETPALTELAPSPAFNPITSYRSESLAVLNLNPEQRDHHRIVLDSVARDVAVGDMLGELGRSSLWTAEHSQRVGEGVGALAIFAGEDFRSARLTVVGALMHDIGKGHPNIRHLLDHPGRYNPAQRSVMKLHATFGMKMAHDAGFDGNVEQLVGCVHTYAKNDPYPENFVFDALPFDNVSGEKPDLERLGAMLAIVDGWDAGQSSRPERPDGRIEPREQTIHRLGANYTGDMVLLEQFEVLVRPPEV
jgi:hypothetical protein